MNLGHPAPAVRQTGWFLVLYAIANAGGVVAYTPFLTLLLPAQMAIAGGEARVEWLSIATFFGAVSASISNIFFGWLSDRRGTRRAWVGAGLVLTLCSYLLIAFAGKPAEIVGAIVVYQAFLNMMLSPLAAWAVETVPHEQKGFLAGLLSAGPPIGALAGFIVTLSLHPGADGRLLLTCAMFATMVAPLVLLGRPTSVNIRPAAFDPNAGSKRELARLWIARLLIQIAASVLFAFLYYYFAAVPGWSYGEQHIAMLPLLSELSALPLTLVLGRLSDRWRTRRPFLVGAALCTSAGLALMATRHNIPVVVGGYFLASASISVFVAFHMITAMQKLPTPQNRARDLGIFNLTNTLPAMISPLLTAWIVPSYGFGALMAILTVLALGSATFVFFVRTATSPLPRLSNP